MTLFFQQLINGFLLGGVYALVAVGLSLTMGVLRLFNLAHAVTISIVGILGVQIARSVALPYPVLVVVGAGIGFIVGAFTEVIAFGPLRRSKFRDRESSEYSVMLASLALLIALRAVAQNYIREVNPTLEALSFPASTFKSHAVAIGPIQVQTIDIVILVTAVVLTALTWYVVQRTAVGRRARAMAADPETAGMLGTNVTRYGFMIVGGAGAFAGVAAMLIAAAFTSVDAATGDSYLLRAFAVIVIGGMGSVMGSFVGGVLLGLIEALTVYFVGSSWVDGVAFAVLFLVLVLRPRGLFGEALVDRA